VRRDSSGRSSALANAHGTLGLADSPEVRSSLPSPFGEDLQKLKTAPFPVIGRAISGESGSRYRQSHQLQRFAKTFLLSRSASIVERCQPNEDAAFGKIESLVELQTSGCQR